VSDELTISGGETTSVATDELYSTAVQLELLTREASALRSSISAIDDVLTRSRIGDASRSALQAETDLDRAAMFLMQVEVQSRFFAFAVSSAADGYTAVELMARRLVGGAIDEVGGVVGSLAPVLAPAALAGAAGFALTGDQGRNQLLSQPAVVAGIRAAVMGADDALLARSGVPRPVAAALGDQGLGVTGVPLAAAALGAVGRSMGMLEETPTRVTRAQTLPLAGIASPSSFAERADRVPEPGALDGAQVVIEKYEMPDGQVRAEVFIAGTVDFDPLAEGEPWDMASNVSNAIGSGSGSYDSVVAAMREAGLTADTPVQLTGYSQGGGTAAQLAASGQFDVRGLVTFGGPTGQVPIPESVPTVIVEHSDDLVAALGGAQENDHAIVVSRWATEGQDFAGAELLPGHQLTAYRETSALMDLSSDPALATASERIHDFSSGGVLVSRVAYECDRVSGGRS
jgi:hypothetical protein